MGGTNIFGTLLSCSAHPQPLRRAAILIHCTVCFHLDLQSGAICPDSLDTKGKIPLCMFQFERLFSCSRVPGDPMDKFVKATNVRHVAVLSRGHAASIEVVTADGKAVSPEELEPRLQAFAAAAARKSDDNWTMLSSLPRSEWAHLREQIVTSSAEHARTVETVESSLFTVSLNAAEPGGTEELTKCMHAGGDGRDVWFDKSFNLMVYANGRAGVHIEHGHFDAPIIIRMLTYCKMLAQDYEGAAPSTTAASVGSPSGWAMLPMSLQALPEVRRAIDTAKDAHRDIVSTHCIECFKYEGYGRKRIVGLKAPADSIFQLALQLAHLRDQGHVTATYETASTRRFFHGRTETIRSCSSAGTAWAKAMDDPSVSLPERALLLNDALKAHIEFLTSCSNGAGCDRHLLGLRVLASATGLTGDKTPAIFSDPAFARSCTFALSTSNVSIPGYGPSNKDFAGFGSPMVDGYGVCYSIQEERITAIVASNRGSAGRSAERFSRVISSALDDVMVLLEAAHALAAEQPSARL